MDSILSGATTPGMSGPESSGNEGVLYIPLDSSLAIWLFSVIYRTLIGKWVLPLYKDSVSVFYSPNRLVCKQSV